MKGKKKRPGKIMMMSGLLLLAAALLLSGYNIWDEWRAGVAAQRALEQLMNSMSVDSSQQEASDTDIPDYELNPNMEFPQEEINGKYFVGTLELPTLGLSLPILSQYVQSDLGIAPCRYAGTAYRSGFVIAGHNYRTHFGSLSRLETGAPVYFTDVNGNRFTYHVVTFQVLEASDVEEMLSEEWDLSLFTCTYSGRTRLTVRCLADQP